MPSEVRPDAQFYLDVAAAHNGDELAIPECSGLQVQNIEEIMAHPFHWAHLSERDAEEVLMELYVARRRRMQ